MKPVIFYVDDEPHNLVVFEAACPGEWEVFVYDSPAKALAELDAKKPFVIVSDQRMPGMSGVQFLEIARKITPNAVRIIVTGFSDEDLVVESVRRAQIFDYIKKPWDVDDLLHSLERAIGLYQATEEARLYSTTLRERERELQESNRKLTEVVKDLELAQTRERDLRQELECWVPPYVLWHLQNSHPHEGAHRDVAGIAMDIVNSSQLHGKVFRGRPLRHHIIQLFSETLLRHGGWRESHAGDSAYGHFGLTEDVDSSADAALAAAREFRSGLRTLADVSGESVECGISLHVWKDCQVQIHTAILNTRRGPVTQKSFDTSTQDVDLLHRMEKLVHAWAGSNIVMSKAFVEELRSPPTNTYDIGMIVLRGQKTPVHLFLKPSDKNTEKDVIAIRTKLGMVAPDVPGETAPMSGLQNPSDASSPGIEAASLDAGEIAVAEPNTRKTG